MGFILHELDVGGPSTMIAYIGVASMLAFAQGVSRIGRAGDDNALVRFRVVRQGASIGELLFISLFVMLNTPLLQASMTGMDIYGFYSITGLTGSSLPLLFAALTNLGLATIAVGFFHFLWKWQYSNRGFRNAYARAVTVLLLPLFLMVYAPTAVLSTTGGEIYYLIVLALMFGAFVVIIAYRDPEVRLDEWESKLSLATVIGIAFLLFTLAIIGMLASYLQTDHAIPDHNWIRSWTVNWESLGYPQSEFVNKLRAGFLWMVLVGVAYMVTVVAGYLLVTIYRHQLVPSRMRGSRMMSTPVLPMERARESRSPVTIEEWPNSPSESIIKSGTKYLVAQNGVFQTVDAQLIDELRASKSEFDLWVDEERGEFLANGTQRRATGQVKALVRYLMCIHGSGEVRDAEIERSVLGYDGDTRTPIKNLYSKVKSTLKPVWGDSVIAVRGERRRFFHPKFRYCWIEIMPEE